MSAPPLLLVAVVALVSLASAAPVMADEERREPGLAIRDAKTLICRLTISSASVAKP